METVILTKDIAWTDLYRLLRQWNGNFDHAAELFFLESIGVQPACAEFVEGSHLAQVKGIFRFESLSEATLFKLRHS